MPPDGNMLGAFVELWVPRHRDRAIVIAPDQRRDVLLEQAEFAIQALQPTGLSGCFGECNILCFGRR